VDVGPSENFHDLVENGSGHLLVCQPVTGMGTRRKARERDETFVGLETTDTLK